MRSRLRIAVNNAVLPHIGQRSQRRDLLHPRTRYIELDQAAFGISRGVANSLAQRTGAGVKRVGNNSVHEHVSNRSEVVRERFLGNRVGIEIEYSDDIR